MPTEDEINEIVGMLDEKTMSGVSRIGVHRVETEREDYIKEVHHYGRCDVGSPFAKGTIKNEPCIDEPSIEMFTLDINN